MCDCLFDLVMYILMMFISEIILFICVYKNKNINFCF